MRGGLQTLDYNCCLPLHASSLCFPMMKQQRCKQTYAHGVQVTTARQHTLDYAYCWALHSPLLQQQCCKQTWSNIAAAHMVPQYQLLACSCSHGAPILTARLHTLDYIYCWPLHLHLLPISLVKQQRCKQSLACIAA